MAKKYLLYIHDDKFDLELHKSQLVNELLEHHYGLTNFMPKDIPSPAKPESVKETPETPLTFDNADEFIDDKKFVRPANKYCSHGAAIGFCKLGCKK